MADRPGATPPRASRATLMRVTTPTVFSGGNHARLLRGGDALFPAMVRAIERARHEIWIATYIYDNVASVTAVTQALVDAAQRGVHVKLLVDGFGTRANLHELRRALCDAGVQVAVFRPLHRWWSWLQPSQLRRLHQKMCVVDGRVAFIGGINMLDDCYDQVHGWTDQPRLDFAVELAGPIVEPIEQAVRALWTRAHVGRNFAKEMATLARSAEPVARARRLLRRLRMPQGGKTGDEVDDLPPVRAAFVMRDNLRQRRAIERSYIHAIRKAKTRVDLISPYFYPGRAFMRVLINAARRGVQVRLLLQGKVDYQIAAVAAQALYDQLLSAGVRVYEYTPAFLHAKVGLVDDEWATVGSSNIDPLSLLLNLEANVVIRDAGFIQTLAAEFDNAVSASREIDPQHARRTSLRGVLRRGFVAWVAHVYLRVAGITGRY
ncbi:MAG TPA: cardiolipin synthase ClsB [Rhizobacter sp.]